MSAGSRARSALREPRLLDAALAAALTVWAILEQMTGETVGSRSASLAGAVALSVPVAVRRRFPLGALAVGALALVGQALAGGSVTQWAAPAVALLILVYSAASYRTGRQAVLGGALALTGVLTAIAIESARGTYDHTVGDYVFAGLWVVAVWAFAYVLRTRAWRIAGLEGETVCLGRDREERERAAVAAERARIARDLHGVVAHTVSVMVVQAAAAEEVLAREPERARAPLVAIQETGSQALLEMRRLLGFMRAAGEQAALGREPGLAGLDALAVEFRGAGLPVEVAVEGDFEAIPPGVDLAAYRLVEEALTNALKHAHGAATRVSIRRSDGALELEVTDNGPGPATGDGSGHGLVGMRERAALYGGTVEAGARGGGGFVVRARLPLAADAGTLGSP